MGVSREVPLSSRVDKNVSFDLSAVFSRLNIKYINKNRVMHANEKLLRAIQIYFFTRHLNLFVIEFGTPRSKKECGKLLAKRASKEQQEKPRLIADNKSLSLLLKRPKLIFVSEASPHTESV